jgi:uncharacterized protein (DUF1684 family)
MLSAMRFSSRILAGSIGVLLGVAGCARPEPGSMVAVEPPAGWEQSVLRFRSERDEYFRTNPDAPLRGEDRDSFEGLDYWAPDPGYYFMGPVNRYTDPERFEIVATSGKRRPCERVGWIALNLRDTPVRLQVYRMLDVQATSDTASLFLPFMDGTTGELTYPAGRYVELLGADGGPYTLDFNLAHNPSCAYGDAERFACPITPAENRLEVPIAAGENGFRQETR